MNESARSAAATEAAEIVEADLPCTACAYNLRTLSWDGKCTECGLPVRRSRLLPGFRFHARRSSYRLLRAVPLLVFSYLLSAMFTIQIVITFLFFFDVSPVVFNAAVRFWAYGPFVARVAGLLAAAWIVDPLHVRLDGAFRRLRIAICWVALAGILANVFLATVWSNIAAWSLSWHAAEMGALLSWPVVQFMMWIYLLGCVRAARNRLLQIVVLAGVSASIATLCGDLLRDLYVMAELGRVDLGRWGPWAKLWSDLWAVENWKKNGQAACEIVMLLALWCFVRKLKAEQRIND